MNQPRRFDWWPILLSLISIVSYYLGAKRPAYIFFITTGLSLLLLLIIKIIYRYKKNEGLYYFSQSLFFDTIILIAVWTFMAAIAASTNNFRLLDNIYLINVINLITVGYFHVLHNYIFPFLRQNNLERAGYVSFLIFWAVTSMFAGSYIEEYFHSQHVLANQYVESGGNPSLLLFIGLITITMLAMTTPRKKVLSS